jgi:tight adherence protein B
VSPALVAACAVLLTAVAMSAAVRGVRRLRLVGRLGVRPSSWQDRFDRALGRHDRRFESLLPDALESISRSLRSSASLLQAVEEATEAVPDPLAADLRRVVLDVRRGLPLADAFQDWATRRGRSSVRLAATAFGIGLEAGGPLAVAIDGVALTLRQQLAMADEIGSLSAQARLSALVIAVAPIGFLAVSTASDRRTLGFLVGTPSGIACLAAGLVLDAIGGLWMGLLTRIEP